MYGYPIPSNNEMRELVMTLTEEGYSRKQIAELAGVKLHMVEKIRRYMRKSLKERQEIERIAELRKQNAFDSYMPTPEEIAEECRRIREGWTQQQRACRVPVGTPKPVETAVVPVPRFDHRMHKMRRA